MSLSVTEPLIQGDLEGHPMPNGQTVYYRDSDHSYWSDVTLKSDGTVSGRGRLTGVSTIVAPFDWRPDNLMKWSARLNGEGVAILAADALSLDDADDMRSALRWLESGDSIWSALQDGNLLYSQARDDAAKRGTNVHKHALQALAEGRPVPDFAELTDEEAGYARGVMAFWHECEPVPILAEQVVCDTGLGVAGRLDLVATIDGKRALVDCKTSGFIPVKHHTQLAGYDHCLAASGFAACDSHLILQVGPDGSYSLVTGVANSSDFLAAVEVYRRAAAIKRTAGQAARLAEAA